MTTLAGLNIHEFGFTEVQDNEIPYHVAGYAKAECSDPSKLNSFQYTPPTGWVVTSCIWMPPGSHGVPEGQPCVLVWCEPKSKAVAITESPGLFPEIVGVPGFVAIGAAALCVVGGWILLAKRS